MVAAAVALLPLVYGPEYVVAELTAPPEVPPPGVVTNDDAADFLEDFWRWLSRVDGAEAATVITMELIDGDSWTLSVDLSSGPEWYATYDATLEVDQWLEFTSEHVVESDGATGDVAIDATAYLVSGLITNTFGDTTAVFGTAIDVSGVSLDDPDRVAGAMIFVPGALYGDVADASRVAIDLFNASDTTEAGNDPCVDGHGNLSCTCRCAVDLDLAVRACKLAFKAALQVCAVLLVGVLFFCWIPCSAVPIPAFQACMVACFKRGAKWVAAECIVGALIAAAICANAARLNYRACLANC